MIDSILLGTFSAGVGAAAAAFVLIIAKGVMGNLEKRDLSFLYFAEHRMRSRKSLTKSLTKSSLSGANAAFIIGGLSGAAAAAVLAHGNLSWVGAGSCAGSLAGWLVYNNIRETRRMRKLREVTALYEAVDFFTAAGYTIPQALRLGSVAAPSLRGCVERCLARYSRDRMRALDDFARDVDLPEAALLASVLAHAEEAGVEAGRSALQEESRALEELRRSLAELRVLSKPLYFAVYRGLPLVAIGGVVVGPLAYRLIKTIQMISSLN